MKEKLAAELGYRVIETGEVIGKSGRMLKPWVDSRGYICFRIGHNTATVAVHRQQAYQLYGEKIYDPSLEVRHLDGNKLNNTPGNIVLGTHQENMLDKDPAVRKRAARIAARVQRKLTEEEVANLRKDRDEGLTYAELMYKYGLAKSTVSYIVNHKTYCGVAQSVVARDC